eukprot:5766223-Prymnesium_polylepis.3
MPPPPPPPPPPTPAPPLPPPPPPPSGGARTIARTCSDTRARSEETIAGLHTSSGPRASECSVRSRLVGSPSSWNTASARAARMSSGSAVASEGAWRGARGEGHVARVTARGTPRSAGRYHEDRSHELRERRLGGSVARVALQTCSRSRRGDAPPSVNSPRSARRTADARRAPPPPPAGTRSPAAIPSPPP